MSTISLDAHAQSTSQPAQSGAGSTPAQPQRPPMPRMAPPYDKNTINLIGPKSGYSPHVGTIVTMLTWMQTAVLAPTRGLKQRKLSADLRKGQILNERGSSYDSKS